MILFARVISINRFVFVFSLGNSTSKSDHGY